MNTRQPQVEHTAMQDASSGGGDFTCPCGNDLRDAYTRHPVSGRALPVRLCRTCAERLVRAPYNEETMVCMRRVDGPPPGRVIRKVLGDV